MGTRFDKLLILDLDETLIHSTESPLERAADLRVGEYHTYKRPHLDRFVQVCSSWFDLAVWTAAGSEYAGEAIACVFPDPDRLKFVFDRRQCTCRHRAAGWDLPEVAIVKRLSKIKRFGYPLSKVLVVDDTPFTFRDNHGNGIVVSEYWGSSTDDELVHLLAFLEYLGPMEDVRPIEKRGWRSQFGKRV